MEEQFIQKLTNVIDAHLDDEHFGVTELANELGMSRTTLHRKVRMVVKKSVSALIRETRLKRGFEILQKKEFTVAEVAYKVGFGSATYFNKCFHDFYGFPPGDILKGNHQIPEDSDKSKILKWRNKLYLIIISLFMIVLATTFYIVFKNNDLTIVVLPPKDLSPGSKTWVLEGFKEGVQTKLTTIDELTVISSTIFEDYRDSSKSQLAIAKKFKAKYMVEISGTTIEEKTTLWVKLIKTATGKIHWSYSYIQTKDNENLIENQQAVVFAITGKLNTNLKPEEKIQIEKRPTQNTGAYNAYMRGIDQQKTDIYERHGTNWKEAKQSYELAIKLDSTFADAWLKLAQVYIRNSIWLEMKSGFLDLNTYNNKLDTVKSMLDKAYALGVSDINQYRFIQSIYCRNSGYFNRASELIEEIWENEEKNFNYYSQIANHNFFKCDYCTAIKNYLKYYNAIPETEPPPIHLTDKLAQICRNTGFPIQSKEIALRRFKQDNDTIGYEKNLIKTEISENNFERAYDRIQELYNSDSTGFHYFQIQINFLQEDYLNAFTYLQKYASLIKERDIPKKPNIILGYLYFINGCEDEAQWHFNGLLENRIGFSDSVVVPRVGEPFIYHELASVYSILGKKEEAFECLNRIAQRETIPRYAINNLNLPFYDTIRNEPEFKRFKGEMQRKYENEHKRIRELLISIGIDPY